VCPILKATVFARIRLLWGGVSTVCISFRAYLSSPVWGPPRAAELTSASLWYNQGAIQFSDVLIHCQGGFITIPRTRLRH